MAKAPCEPEPPKAAPAPPPPKAAPAPTPAPAKAAPAPAPKAAPAKAPKAEKKKELPKTGGTSAASLFALGAGALLVGGGLLARRFIR